MALVGEFSIDCEHLPLVGVAAAVPDATLELDLQFDHGPRPMFVVTATGGARDAFAVAFDEAIDVDAWTFVGRAGETRRFKATPALSIEEQLGDALDDLDDLAALARADAIVERIRVTNDGWRQTAWFADRAAFDQFRSFWQRNAGFRLHRLTRDGEAKAAGDGLTDRQREALRTAYQLGYFEIPRRTSLEAVADELGVAASSASERLRRAQTELVEKTVATSWPPLPGERASK